MKLKLDSGQRKVPLTPLAIVFRFFFTSARLGIAKFANAAATRMQSRKEHGSRLQHIEPTLRTKKRELVKAASAFD
jgi:hypothetical protein